MQQHRKMKNQFWFVNDVPLLQNRNAENFALLFQTYPYAEPGAVQIYKQGLFEMTNFNNVLIFLRLEQT
jgi:hypothetical protein